MHKSWSAGKSDEAAVLRFNFGLGNEDDLDHWLAGASSSRGVVFDLESFVLYLALGGGEGADAPSGSSWSTFRTESCQPCNASSYLSESRRPMPLDREVHPPHQPAAPAAEGCSRQDTQAAGLLLRHTLHWSAAYTETVYLHTDLPPQGTLVAASFVLSRLTQTRYDYNATKVQAVSHEEQLRLKHDRKKIDLREEYFRLTSALDRDPGPPDSGGAANVAVGSPPDKTSRRRDMGIEWDGEQKRVQRLPGMEEWSALTSLPRATCPHSLLPDRGAVDPRQRSPDVGVRLV